MNITKAFVSLAAFAFLASCGSSNVAVKHTEPTSRGGNMAMKFHESVNRYRVSQGLSRLKYHKGLAKLAQEHSEFMMSNAGKFSLDGSLVTHFGFDGRHLMAQRRYSIETIGENVAASFDMEAGDEMVEKMVQGWISSPNHRHNLRSKWKISGVGVAVDAEGRVFVTQLYGTSANRSQMVGGPNNW